MRKLSGVKQLGRTYSHRKAMLANMATSLLQHERIITTKEKAKEVRKLSEKLITRAKNNLSIDDKKSNKAVHNKRVVLKTIKDRNVVAKLFDDIAERVKDRKGGYTRILLLDKRPGDGAEKAIIELVDRKVEKKKAAKVAKTDDKKADKKDVKKPAKKTEKKADKKAEKAKTEKKDKKAVKKTEKKDKK
jgi:large subunit ribosomal protein L17